MTVLTELALPSGVEAERPVSAVLADLRLGGHRGVLVDSPPGAGKSTAAVRAAVALAVASKSLIALWTDAQDEPEDCLKPW